MIGICRECKALISSGPLNPNPSPADAVANGMVFFQQVREHWLSTHPQTAWIEAEAVGQLAACFPFLPGADIDQSQRAVLVLTYTALKNQLFGVGYEAKSGKFGMRPVDIAMSSSEWIGCELHEAVSCAAKVELLETLLHDQRNGVAIDLAAMLRSEEDLLKRMIAGSGSSGLVRPS